MIILNKNPLLFLSSYQYSMLNKLLMITLAKSDVCNENKPRLSHLAADYLQKLNNCFGSNDSAQYLKKYVRRKWFGIFL